MRPTSGSQAGGTHLSYLGSQRGRLVLQFLSRQPLDPAECRAIRSQFRGIHQTRLTTLGSGIQDLHRLDQGRRDHLLQDPLPQLFNTISSITAVCRRLFQVPGLDRRSVCGLQEVSQVVSPTAPLAAPVTEGRHGSAGAARTLGVWGPFEAPISINVRGIRGRSSSRVFASSPPRLFLTPCGFRKLWPVISGNSGRCR